MVNRFKPQIFALLLAFCGNVAAQPEDAQASPEADPPESSGSVEGEPNDAEPVPTIPVREAEPEDEPLPVADGAQRLDDITVTSSKRIKSQRDIPASVGAFRGEDLEKINAVSIKDYLKTVPGVSLVEREQDRSSVTIRGISTSTGLSNSGAGTVAGTTGVFIDELPLNDAFRQLTVPDINPFDLERVEVLKGPQGTLFGSGALAGAVRYITKKPDMGVWNAKLQSTYSSNRFGEPRQFIAGAVNVPIFRNEAALRIAVNYLDRGGMIDKRSSFEAPDSAENQGVPEGMRDQRLGETDNGKDVDDLQQHTIRAAGQWDFNDRLRFNVLGLLQEAQFDDSVQVDNFDADFSSRNDPTASPGESRFGAFNFVPSYEFDWGTLTSSTGYVIKDFETRSAVLATVGEETVLPPDDEPGDDFGTEEVGTDATRPIPFGSEQTGYIQEFRLSSPEGADSRWEWLGGVSYYNSKQFYFNITPTSPEFTDTRNGLPVDQCPAPACPVPTPLGDANGTEYEVAQLLNDTEGEEMALFGEATYKFFEDEQVELTLGGRLFRNRLQAILEGRGVTSSFTIGRVSYREDFDYSEDGFNPKASLRYIITPTIQTYVLAAKGFQFGGVQVSPPISGDEFIFPEEAVTSYDSSKLWLYEWGWRTDWFDRRMRLDWTAYYYDWQDLQLRVDNLLPNPLPKEPEFPNDVPVFEDGVRDEQTRRRPFGNYIDNVGRARSTGVEASLSISPARGLTFVSSANWLKARLIDQYVGSGGTIIPAGTPLAGAPPFQISNSLSYTTPFRFFGDWEGGASLTHTHVSETRGSIESTSEATQKFDSLSGQLHLGRPNWFLSPDLRFTISNITDERAIQGITGSNAGRNLKVYYNQPRTAILALDLKW